MLENLQSWWRALFPANKKPNTQPLAAEKIVFCLICQEAGPAYKHLHDEKEKPGWVGKVYRGTCLGCGDEFSFVFFATSSIPTHCPLCQDPRRRLFQWCLFCNEPVYRGHKCPKLMTCMVCKCPHEAPECKLCDTCYEAIFRGDDSTHVCKLKENPMSIEVQKMHCKVCKMTHEGPECVICVYCDDIIISFDKKPHICHKGPRKGLPHRATLVEELAATPDPGKFAEERTGLRQWCSECRQIVKLPHDHLFPEGEPMPEPYPGNICPECQEDIGCHKPTCLTGQKKGQTSPASIKSSNLADTMLVEDLRRKCSADYADGPQKEGPADNEVWCVYCGKFVDPFEHQRVIDNHRRPDPADYICRPANIPLTSAEKVASDSGNYAGPKVDDNLGNKDTLKAHLAEASKAIHAARGERNLSGDVKMALPLKKELPRFIQIDGDCALGDDGQVYKFHYQWLDNSTGVTWSSGWRARPHEFCSPLKNNPKE